MTSTEELANLIEKARTMGAVVQVTYDEALRAAEGRVVIETILVSGLKGCGVHPMSAIGAAERLRELTAG